MTSYASESSDPQKKLKMTIPRFVASKAQGNKLSMTTAYDYLWAGLFDEAGIDSILVGDSLGMVVLGYPDTTHVTMDHMLHHTAAAARGNKNALLVADFPIGRPQNPKTPIRLAVVFHLFIESIMNLAFRTCT